MSNRNTALTALRAFLTDPSDAHAAVLRPHLSSDVAVSVHTTNEQGPDAAINALQESLFHNVVFGGEWQEPYSEDDTVSQLLSMPTKAIATGCKFSFTFNAQDEVTNIEGEWMLPAAQLAPEPIVLTTAIRARINNAEEDLMPVLLGYVSGEGCPEQMYRSSIHVYGDDQLAFWNPRPDGRFLESIAAKPGMSAIYRHSDTHEMLELSGRARVIDDEAEAQRIYDARPEIVQRADPDRRGVAVVIDLDRVTGLIHAAETGAIERILMARSAD